MFNGLIREIAIVENLQDNILTLKAKYQPRIGDSIAVNGACLTVIAIRDNIFSLELSQETQKNIALENYKKYVHIEPALTLQDKIDGHIMQGHIDGIGKITSIKKNKNQIEFIIQAPKEILLLCVPKGSIGIDGISLTLTDVSDKDFKLVIIPHTFENTLFHTYKINQRVNIESDMFVRNMLHLLEKQKANSLWLDFDNQVLSY